jgi:hypothetical protein
MNPYLSFGIRQGIDVVAVVMLAYGIYLRTSRRWDVARRWWRSTSGWWPCSRH